MKRIERILVFELNWMGDILFSFPLLRSLREAYPQAHIACAVVPRYEKLLSSNKWIDSVLPLSDRRGILSIVELIKFTSKARKEKYDAAILLKPSKTKACIAEGAGIPERVGFAGKESSLTKVVEIPKANIHRVDQLLSLLTAFGVKEVTGNYEYNVPEKDKKRARETLLSSGYKEGKLVVLNPGGNWPPKRWPRENFSKLASMLLDFFPGIEIAVTGADKDEDLASYIVKESGGKRCFSIAGKTTLEELAAVFSLSKLVVSSDSGPLHLASATGATTISIFGPTSRYVTGPRSKGENIVITEEVECEVPCYIDNCGKDYNCMRKISPEKVFSAAKNILTKTG